MNKETKISKQPKVPMRQSDFILYTSQTGNVKVDVFFKEDTVWLTQKATSFMGTQQKRLSKNTNTARLYKSMEKSLDTWFPIGSKPHGGRNPPKALS